MEENRFSGERLESKSNLSRNNLLEHLARYNLVVGNPEGVVLDIGCGAGHGSNKMSHKFKKIYGVDFDAEAVEYAQKNWSEKNVSYLRGSGTDIPFEDNFFEIAVAFEVFEHIQDWKKFLSELKRVVKDGGFIFISTPNKDIYSPGTKKPINPHHFFEMTITEFKDALNEFFSIKKFYGQRTPVYNDHWIWKLVNPVLFSLSPFINYKFNNTLKLKIINWIKPTLEESDIVFFEDETNIKKARFMVAVCQVKK